MAAESDYPMISNNFVKCYSDRLVIDLYYFPYGNKTIKYSEIASCELLQISDLGMFKIKTWGMALSPIWWHSDFRRYSREQCIIIDINKWPKIGLTMDDNDIVNVYQFIKQKIDPNKSSEKEIEYQMSSKNNKIK